MTTLSLIKADTGGFVGHSEVHPDMMRTARIAVQDAVAGGLLIDGQVARCGDDISLIMTHWSQLWIDRNFALDYTLKSLEKILDGRHYEVVRDLRRMLKNAAYQLLGGMINALGRTDTLTSNHTELEVRCAGLAEAMIRELHTELAPAVASVQADLSADQRRLLQREHDRWAAATDWRSINAADPCGT